MERRAKIKLSAFALLGSLRLLADSNCVNFPPQEVPASIPFASVAYVTAANGAGDHLVVGPLTGGASEINAITANIALPAFPNQMFCGQVQLAPQQFFSNVYVPTAAELGGNFSAFAGLLVDPATNQPFSGGMIPPNKLGAVFAWRIGPTQVSSQIRGWSPSGTMSAGRLDQAQVRLPSGKVLVVGGGGARTAELYDPMAGTFSPAGQMTAGHGNNPSATLLNDGRVLVLGGTDAPSTAEIYDPASNQFTAISSPIEPHGWFHTATLLNDGRVLIVGGLAMPFFGSPTGQGDRSAGAEVYDPKTGTFSQTGPMSTNRTGHIASILADGRVLVAGGQPVGATATPHPLFSTAEIYDPSTNSFSPTGSMQARRVQHTAVLLSNGKVLVVGGFGGEASAELFDPSTGKFTPGGSLNGPRRNASAVLLSSGQVLVEGGDFGPTQAGLNSAELYNPASGSFTVTGSLVTARTHGRATLLLDGRVLAAGGAVACCSPQLFSAELYTPVTQGLVTSQTGLTFRAAQGAGALPAQNVAVLSSTATIPWNVSVKTYSGGNWLKATPSGGTSSPGATPVVLSITADASGLAAQDYYGVVTLTPTDGVHPPVSIAIVLSIVPAGAAAPPSVSPSGLLFLAAPGGSVKPQTFGISNLTSKAITFTAAGSAVPSFFDFNPKMGSVAAGQTATITVTPTIAGLAAGVYRGSIKLTFGDNSTQTVDLLLVLSPTAGSVTAREDERAASGCTAAKLLPVFTTIGSGFTTPAAWPTPLAVQVVDDCGVAVNNGTVSVSFTNGDSPLSLLAIGGASWTGTWVPVHNSTTAFAVRADARQGSLSGSVQVTGQVAVNPKVPIVAAGGVVSSGDYSSSPALGLLVSIFGTALADGVAGANSLPLPQQVGSTQVLLSGVPVPVLYVTDSQVNVLVPYDQAVNAPNQLIVQRGNAISVPAPIAIFDSQPAILATAGNGMGQGHIYKVDSAGNQILADANSPATAGDVLVIYTVGLGAVDPPVKAGDPAPYAPLSATTAPVTVTIGGQQAVVFFAGLTPGAAGLYQVNAIVPDGIDAGDQVPVVVSVAGKGSAGSIYMGIQ